VTKYTNIELLEKAPVLTTVVRLALPTILGIIVQLVYNLTDTYFIGLLDDYNQIAAISLAMPIMMVTNALSHIFSAGAPSFISRLLGRKMLDEVRKVSSFAIYTTLVMGILVVGLMLVFLKPILFLIGASEATYGYTYDYVFIILLFSTISMTAGTLQGILRSEGSTNLASIGMIIGAVGNMILDPLFILVFNMGVKGAAIATILGNVSSFVFFIFCLRQKDRHVSMSPKYYHPNIIMIKEILSIGIPSSLSMILMSFSMIFFNKLAAGYGDFVVAASGVASKVVMVAVMIIMGISMGMQPFFGYNYGAKYEQRLFSGIKVSIFLGTGICVAFTVFLGFAANWCIRLFSSDPQVIATGSKMLFFTMFGLPLMGIQMTFMTYLQATGQAVKAMVVNLSRQCLILVPAVTIMNYLFKLNGFLLAQTISDIATTTLAIILVLPEILKLAKKQEGDQ
jgi:putative MATE family efflux protein